jgi:hypothetical protein
MSVRVTHSPAFDVALRHVRPRTARTVCAAVIAFARDGSGKIKELSADDEPSGFVQVYGWAGFAVVEVREDEIYVWGIFARPSVPRVRPLLDEPRPAPSDDDPE